MGLNSKLLKGDVRLESCLVSDPAHVTPGTTGDFVVKIQKALVVTDSAAIAPTELSSKTYGPTTTQAVLNFKKNPKRTILNYRGQFDPIVGKKTIAALDAEMVVKEGGSVSPDMQLVNAANARRLEALNKAEEAINRLKRDFEPGVPDSNDPVVQALGRQLFIVLNSNFWPLTNQFLAMVVQNKTITAPLLVDRADPNFAHVDPSNQPAKGVTFGASFFAPSTNDNCRQEVATHEFFHFIVGLQHFYSTTNNAEAMKCPHHLARAVFDIAFGQQLAPCDPNGSVCR
jgi:hypothetical protein